MRALFCLSILLVASVAHATTLTIDVLGYRFIETNTPTVCLHCDDADLSNDFVAVLWFPTFIPVPPGFTSVGFSGFVDFTGTTATEFTDVDLHIAIDIAVWLDDIFLNEGMLTGALFVAPESSALLIETYCGGDIGPISIGRAFYPPMPFTLPFEGRILAMEVFPPRPTEVPEPSSLLLLSTGLLAVIRRLRAPG